MLVSKWSVLGVDNIMAIFMPVIVLAAKNNRAQNVVKAVNLNNINGISQVEISSEDQRPKAGQAVYLP